MVDWCLIWWVSYMAGHGVVWYSKRPVAEVWWADADPPTAHGRCWVTAAEQNGMWTLEHCSSSA